MTSLNQVKSHFKILAISTIIGLLPLSFIIYNFTTSKFKSSCGIYIYTYSSFASSTGAGGDLQKLFKEKTGCDAHFENIGDARTLLQRLRSELKIKNKVDADIVLGLDQFSIQEAYKLLKWKDISFDKDIKFSKRLNETGLSKKDINPFDTFIAYNWSPFTFIYRQNNIGENKQKATIFKTPQDILTSNIKYSLMDPRSSSPGFQFLVWIINQFGEKTLYHFMKNTYLISPSWSTAYGLFTKGQTHAAFSYLTSLAYHWIEENNTAFQIMNFSSGHPYQIEFAGVIADSPRLEVATQFLQFLYQKEAQNLIMTKNYMFPITQSVEQKTAFAKLPYLPLIENHSLQNPESAYLQYWKQFGVVSQNANID